MVGHENLGLAIVVRAHTSQPISSLDSKLAEHLKIEQ